MCCSQCDSWLTRAGARDPRESQSSTTETTVFPLHNLKRNILSLLQVRIKSLNPAYAPGERIIGGLEYQEVGIIGTALQSAEHTDFPAFALVPC